jgi:hypothetical protein
MDEERWWKAPGKVALTSTETNTVFGLHWPGEPRNGGCMLIMEGPSMDYVYK